MVAATAKSNLSWQQQSANTLFMTEPLLNNFWYLPNKRAAQEVIAGIYVAPIDTPKYVLELFATLVMLESIRKLGLVDLSISQSNNSAGWPEVKERTG